MQLHPAGTFFLVAFYVLSSLVLIGLIGAAAYLILKLNRLLEEYQQKIDPILIKADNALTIIADKADSIGGKAESLLAQSEEVAESVHEKVDRTAVAVQKTINAPIIGANSLVAGFTRGILTFTRLQSKEPKVTALEEMEIFEEGRGASDTTLLLDPLSDTPFVEIPENGAEKRNASSLSTSESIDTNLNPVFPSPAEPVGGGVKRT
jgi:uncharacterized protein YoxC